MKSKKNFFVLIVFTYIFFISGCQKNKEIEKLNESSFYKMEDFILENESSAIDEVKKENEVSFIQYRKLKQWNHHYYLLAEDEMEGTGFLFILNEEGKCLKKIPFEKACSAVFEDIYVKEQEESFWILSVETKEYTKDILYLDQYNWEGKLLIHKEIAETSAFAVKAIGNNGICVVDEDEKMVYLYNIEGKIVWKKKEIGNIFSIVYKEIDGYFYAMAGNVNDKGQYGFLKINFEKGNVEQIYILNNTTFTTLPILIDGKNEYDLYYYNKDSGVYGYDLEKEYSIKIIDWINSGIDEDCFGLCVWKEKSFLCLSGENREHISFKKIVPSEKDEREVLTIGLQQFDNWIGEVIKRYNQEEKNIRLEVKNYSEYEDMQFQLDISAGHCPDIIDIRLMEIETLIEKEVLTDLYPFMEKDKEIDSKQFIENLLKLLEYDQKLYAMPISFCLQFLACDKKDFIDNDISIDKIQRIWKKEPTISIFPGSNRNVTFSEIIGKGSIKRFFHSKEGEQVLYNLLEFIKLLPNSNEDGKVYFEKVKDGEALFYPCYIATSPGKTFAECDYCYGENEYIFMGYPTGEKTGICLSSGSNTPFFGISSVSNKKQEAWKFIRSFFTKEKQRSVITGLPVRKDILKELFLSEATGALNAGNIQLEYSEGLTEEQQKMLMNIIDSADYFEMPNTIEKNLHSVLCEEVDGYFSDDKKLEEVIKIMKNRINLFLNE